MCSALRLCAEYRLASKQISNQAVAYDSSRGFEIPSREDGTEAHPGRSALEVVGPSSALWVMHVPAVLSVNNCGAARLLSACSWAMHACTGRHGCKLSTRQMPRQHYSALPPVAAPAAPCMQAPCQPAAAQAQGSQQQMQTHNTTGSASCSIQANLVTAPLGFQPRRTTAHWKRALFHCAGASPSMTAHQTTSSSSCSSGCPSHKRPASKQASHGKALHSCVQAASWHTTPLGQCKAGHRAGCPAACCWPCCSEPCSRKGAWLNNAWLPV